MKDKFYYIVGVSLLVLLILVVYVGSRVQNVELGLANVDSRFQIIERALGVSGSTIYDSGSASGQYGAGVYDAFDTGYDYYTAP